MEWHAEDLVVITGEDVLGDARRVSCSYRDLPAEVRDEDRLLIDDGKVVVRVTSVTGPDIHCP